MLALQTTRRACPPTCPQQAGLRGGLAYIVSRFPKDTETFIKREIEVLLKDGIPLIILPLKGRPGHSFEEVDPKIRKHTLYIRAGHPRVIISNLLFFLREPRLYFSMLFFIGKKHLSQPREIKKLLGYYPKAVFFSSICKKLGVKHIHAHWATRPTTAAYIISDFSGIPFSFMGHAHDIFTKPPFLKEKLEAAQFVRTCSKFARDFLKAISKKAHIFTTYHGISLDSYVPKTKYKRNFEIFTAARLIEKKGLATLVEACKLLKEQNIVFKCTIAGEGPMDKELQKLKTLYGLKECLHLIGSVPHNDVKQYIQNASMVILPCMKEEQSGSMDGIPNILIEALASGVPVISTPISGIPELVEDGKTGLLVPPDDPMALKDAIIKLGNDVELQRQIGREGRKKVEQLFDIEKNIVELRNIFTEALK